MKLYPITAMTLVLVLAASAFAQNNQLVPKAPFLEPNSPSHLGGQAPGLAMESDAEPRNSMVAGVTLGAVYDSQGLYHNDRLPNYSGDVRYFVQPSIGLQRTYSEGAWTLSYSPGASISQNDTEDSQYTHNFAGDVSWRPNSYFLLHARQDFSLTNNPFETVGRVDLLPGLGGPLGPNYDGVLPETRRTSIVSTVDLTYRVAEHRAVGLTGEFQRYDFDATKSGTTSYPYINSKVFSGSAFVSQQFSPSINLGLQIAYADIYSGGAVTSRTQAPTPMLFARLTPDSHLEVTLYGGPTYARTRDLLSALEIYQHHWYATYGGSAVWSGQRNSFTVEGLHRLSNGGGVLQAVQATSAGAGYRTQVLQRMLAEVRVNWSDEKGIDLLSHGNYFRSLWAGGGPVFELNRSLDLRTDVACVHQSQSGTLSGFGNHVMVEVSLDYHFHKGLGN